jgi:hypothetical protein
VSGVTVVRALIGVGGVLLLIGGVALVFFAGSGGLFAAFWMIVSGVVLIIGVVVERSRYRSQAAERGQLSPGPGGGETAPLEPRFRATDEVFVDPTTNARMRVYLDSNTGERRYVAES